MKQHHHNVERPSTKKFFPGISLHAIPRNYPCPLRLETRILTCKQSIYGNEKISLPQSIFGACFRNGSRIL